MPEVVTLNALSKLYVPEVPAVCEIEADNEQVLIVITELTLTEQKLELMMESVTV